MARKQIPLHPLPPTLGLNFVCKENIYFLKLEQ